MVRNEINNRIAKLKSMFMTCWKKAELALADFNILKVADLQLRTYKFSTFGIAVAYFKNLDLRNCSSGLFNTNLRSRTCGSAFTKISDLW